MKHGLLDFCRKFVKCCLGRFACFVGILPTVKRLPGYVLSGLDHPLKFNRYIYFRIVHPPVASMQGIYSEYVDAGHSFPLFQGQECPGVALFCVVKCSL